MRLRWLAMAALWLSKVVSERFGTGHGALPMAGAGNAWWDAPAEN